MYSALSTLETTTEVPLSTNSPLLWECVHGVCVFTAVCVHLDELNSEHKFWVWITILGHTSLHFFPLSFIHSSIHSLLFQTIEVNVLQNIILCSKSYMQIYRTVVSQVSYRRASHFKYNTVSLELLCKSTERKKRIQKKNICSPWSCICNVQIQKLKLFFSHNIILFKDLSEN